ncbi:MAG: hypothetical protein ACRDD3_06020, partial [Azovibrio sp.]
PDAMKNMVEAFTRFSVTKEHIEKRIQRRLDSIQPAQVVSLKKIYASLRDAMSSPADWFDIEDPESGQQPVQPTGSRTEAIKAKARAAKPQQDPLPPTAAEDSNEQKGAE